MESSSAQFTVKETDDTITHGSRMWNEQFRDRLNYDRLTVLTQAINAWRNNPIARRIIELTTEFVIGDGFSFSSNNTRVQHEIEKIWNNPLNDLDQQITEWADEAWRTGDLFILFSVDQGNMPYVRAIQSEMIQEIVVRNNDYRQEIAYKRNQMDDNPYPAYNPDDPEQSTFVLHFPLNRMAGSSFGESDLAPILYWISLYRQWLEDRARAAHNAALFSYVITKPFASPEEKKQYINDFNARMPKKPGSIIALGVDEIIGTITAGLQSFEATQDGLAIKKMIATGAGIPTHYLAEPESSTRTTAEAAGTPAFKRFKSRQIYLRHVVQTVVLIALAIRRRSNNNLPTEPEFKIITPDVSERDNAQLAIAAQRIVAAFAPLYNAKIIDIQELIRIVYRFIGETPPEKLPEKFVPINVRGGGKQPTDNQPENQPENEPQDNLS